MNFDEALNAVVTKAQAVRELKKHGFTFEEFAKDCGDQSTYKGKTVLVWLGY